MLACTGNTKSTSLQVPTCWRLLMSALWGQCYLGEDSFILRKATSKPLQTGKDGELCFSLSWNVVTWHALLSGSQAMNSCNNSDDSKTMGFPVLVSASTIDRKAVACANFYFGN